MDKKNAFLYLIIGLLIIGVVAAFIIGSNSNKEIPTENKTQTPSSQVELKEPQSFKNSEFYLLEKEDILLLLQKSQPSTNYRLETTKATGSSIDMVAGASMPSAFVEGSIDDSISSDYSETNVQVEGIDEGDIVKTNGNKIFIAKPNKLIVINNTAPPLEDIYSLEISETSENNTNYYLYTPEERINSILLDSDLLYLITTSYQVESKFDYSLLYPQMINIPTTVVTTYKINENDLEELSKVEVDGEYYQSRLKNNFVYLLTNNHNFYYTNPILLGDIIINPIKETKSGKITTQERTVIMPKDSSLESKNLYTVTTLKYSSTNNSVVDSLDLLLDYSSTIYMSNNNLYIAHKENSYPIWRTYGLYNNDLVIFKEIYKNIYPSSIIKELENNLEDYESLIEIINEYYKTLDENQKEELYKKIETETNNYYMEKQKEREKTLINKIELEANGKLGKITSGSVEGNLLNQFSLDEDSEGYLRVALTYTNSNYKNENSIVILDSSLKKYSALDKLAEDERIYSVRFLKDKVFLVTFKQVDPFFVIDLSDRKNPEVLGYLKIPGYSSYLHPISDTLILGVGQDVKENQWGGTSQVGVKATLFDVSDYKDPKEVSTFIVDTDNSYSPIQNDHKAFLYIKKNNLIVIPVVEYYNTKGPGNNFYVLDIEGNTIKEKKVISHLTNAYHSGILRSLYIEDELFTISDNKIVTYNFDTEDTTEVTLK